VKEILARVRSVLRRARPQMDRREATLESPPLSLDHSRREVRLAGRVLSLTTTEYGLLRHLMSHPGRVLSRPQLLDAVGDGRSASSGRSIDVHVLSLRRKLGDQGAMIGTARGFGYVFAPLKNPAAGDAVGLRNA
jgi:DNA-binding response OmpR family regulator